MNKRIISILTTGIMLYFGLMPVPMVTAATEEQIVYSEYAHNRTDGLIHQCYNYITASNRVISFNAWTYSFSSMSSIGLKNISVERSLTGSYWTEETSLSDRLNSNTDRYILTGYPIYVAGGYYYRIVCDHYADDGYGTTQSLPSISNTIWVS